MKTATYYWADYIPANQFGSIVCYFYSEQDRANAVAGGKVNELWVTM